MNAESASMGSGEGNINSSVVENEGQPATIEHLIVLLISSNKLLLDVNNICYYNAQFFFFFDKEKVLKIDY